MNLTVAAFTLKFFGVFFFKMKAIFFFKFQVLSVVNRNCGEILRGEITFAFVCCFRMTCKKNIILSPPPSKSLYVMSDDV